MGPQNRPFMIPRPATPFRAPRIPHSTGQISQVARRTLNELEPL